MDTGKTPRRAGMLVLLVVLVAVGTEPGSAVSSPTKDRCFDETPVTHTARTRCHSCLISALVECPAGFKKKRLGVGDADCKYTVNTVKSLGLSMKGCSHECYKEVVERHCCAGYWGTECMECPENSQKPCNNNGVCSDGMAGNGTCSCKAGFTGTACEDCISSNYGPTCSSVCSCVHGICNSGIKGDGQCTCFSGYKGPRCDQELPACTSLQCSQNARCTEDALTGQLQCRCLAGYQGNGVECTSINPCLQNVCHSKAVCAHLGPNQHSCTCAQGYQGDGAVCMPVDPCQTNFGGCSATSASCVYDAPGKSHCECLDGYEKLTPSGACSLREACAPGLCSNNAVCTTTGPGAAKCTCNQGYIGDGKVCYGNIMQRLQELNSEPNGQWTGQLSNAITLFESTLSWALSSLGPFTLFVPLNKGFKGTSVNTLLADQMNAQYLCKLHLVAGQLSFDTLKKGDVYYTLTGKSGETVTNDEDQQIKIRLHGSRKKGDIVQSDVIASNGVIHIINKLMDSVPPTVNSEKEESLVKILTDNGKFNKFKSFLEKANVVSLLEGAGPFTLFAPTSTALDAMNQADQDFLLSDQGKSKLLELVRNHVVQSVGLEVVNIASSPRTVTMANQVLTFNVTNNGQILVNGAVILEADVLAKNGRLYSVDAVLIPASIEPILPRKCDIIKSSVTKGNCVRCSQVTKSTCPSGVAMDTFSTGCVFRDNVLGVVVPTLGCSLFCNETVTTPLCCKGFYGPDCSPCPGGFSTPCSGQGQCMDGIEGDGTCVCKDGFKGSRCQFCSNPSKYGPACDKTCLCIHGECDNQPDGDGSCKPGTCQDAYTGKFCERHTQTCGPRVEFCHAHAKCDFNGGAVRCVCNPGYQGDGITCVETDPCALPYRGGCSVNAKCIKTGPGSHTCQCLRGWRSDGDGCQAINNCLDPAYGGCHANATCIYIGPGQNDCECKNGFRGNGKECEPVNQCVQQNGGCHYMATCRYLSPGAWKCVCKEGYSGDGQVCYGTVAQELSVIPEGSAFYKWVTDAGVSKLLSSSRDFTLLIPSNSAVQNMAKADRDFWTTRKDLTTLIKYHMILGVYQLADLRNASTLLVTTFLKTSLPVSWNNMSTAVGGATVTSSDIAATNGVIHVIDKVFIPDRKLSEGLLQLLDQRLEYSLFRNALIQYNLTQELEKAPAYTVFAPTDSAIKTYLIRSGSASLDLNTTRNHIILSEKLMKSDLGNGVYKETLLGFAFQVGFFLRDGQVFVNDAQVALSDVETSKGVIHGLSAVLEVIMNRCDREDSNFFPGVCLDCFTTENPCPEGTKATTRLKNRCMLKRVVHKELITIFGCRMLCKNSTIVRQCCGGFFGRHCERCPGPAGQPCFGNGVCQDGSDGPGTCQCSTGFAGTACETCQPGKYSIHCDQDCKCAHGRCKEGPQGDGTCECDVGWRGVYCDTAITQDMCSGRCHSSANCIVQADGSSFCKCATGFEGNGTYCIGSDACALNNGGCAPKATCKRTGPGSRTCLCQSGYAGDGLVCIAINPCLVGNGGCHENAQCVHTGPNKTACTCNKGFSGDGSNCTAINPCKTRNGNCHRYAQCNMTGPGERSCTCRMGYVGDGLTCKGSVEEEFFMNKNSSVREFIYFMARAKVQELNGLGPFTVFAPPGNLFSDNWAQWRARGVISDIMRYHVVSCRTLLPADLTKPRNLTTLQGEPISITYAEDTIYINKNTKVVFSDSVSANGIIHIIDSVLLPESVQAILRTPASTTPTPALQNLTDVARVHGYTKFTKLLEDTNVMSLLNDRIHQPVTLFWPSDKAMDALPQAQKDFLYSTQNRAQLQEYLKFHIVREAMVFSSALVYTTLKTLQGSDLSVKCAGDDDIGKLLLNNGKCQITQRQLPFSAGIAHGIDCLLSPPSLGGRCDTIDTLTVEGTCGRCSRLSRCPSGSKFKEKKQCDLAVVGVSKMSGCQAVCTVVFWRSKCCSGYYGRDCLACPGGPKSVCSTHGKCDEGHFGTGNCTCDAGFQGVACELCAPGRYGPACKACNCTEHGSCQEGRKGSGACFCDEGWTGKRCESPLVEKPVCSPPCSSDAVCKENNTCECKPFYEGDGLTCTLADLCGQVNGGCAAEARCSQKGVKVTCVCQRGYSGDGYVCLPIDPCDADDNGGCNEHATCSMTGPGRRKCDCNTGYIGDGVNCDVKELPINRCAQGNGQCHSDAQCTDLHFEDTKVGVFHVRSPLGQYHLNYTQAQEACQERGGTMASYVQLSYAQQAGFNMCSAGWLEKERVAYPTTFSSPKCGFGHVGIVDYGPRVNLSETWDGFCYRMQDVQCTCKLGYIGDGYECTGNILQVLTATPNFSNFLSQILNFSRGSERGREFLGRITNITLRSTLFVPDNSGLEWNKTLSDRDIDYHLSEGSALFFQDLTNGTRIRTRLGHSLQVLGIADFNNASVLTSRYINDRFLINWDILASNGVIHVLQGPLQAPPKEPEFHAGHKAGMGLGVLLVVALLGAAAFGLYRFHGQRANPFQFHYFKDEDGDPAEAPQPEDLNPSICNPVYDSSVSAPVSPAPPAVSAPPAFSATPAYPSYMAFPEGDTHGLMENDLLQDS